MRSRDSSDRTTCAAKRRKRIEHPLTRDRKEAPRTREPLDIHKSFKENPWHGLYTDIKRRHGKANPAKSAVARKVLIASWHILSRNEPFKPSASSATDPVPASSSIRLTA